MFYSANIQQQFVINPPENIPHIHVNTIHMLILVGKYLQFAMYCILTYLMNTKSNKLKLLMRYVNIKLCFQQVWFSRTYLMFCRKTSKTRIYLNVIQCKKGYILRSFNIGKIIFCAQLQKVSVKKCLLTFNTIN